MGYYQRKPVIVEARQFTGNKIDTPGLIDWILSHGGTARYHEAVTETEDAEAVPEHLQIDTLEGTMRASVGDWIIRGVKNEFYPCKPDIFREIYEATTNARA